MAESDLILRRLDEIEKRGEDRFHALNLRFDDVNRRLDDFNNRLSGLDTRLTSLESRLETKFDGLETRLNTKAGNWTVNLWGASLAVVIGLLGGFMAWLKVYH